jgi:hypothetical protein
METRSRYRGIETVQDATFQTGSTHADCSPSSARDGMSPLPRLESWGTNCTGQGITWRANIRPWRSAMSVQRRKHKLNSVALVRKRTILVGEDSANVCGGQRNGSRFSRPEVATFHSRSSSVILNEAKWTPFQTNYFSENMVAQGIEPGTSESVARNSDH